MDPGCRRRAVWVVPLALAALLLTSHVRAQPSDPNAPFKIPGWSNAQAFQEASAARAAEQVGRFDQCIEHDQKSLKLEQHPRVQLHLAACEMRSGKLIDALKNANDALKRAISEDDAELQRIGKLFVGRILEVLPHVKFTLPANATSVTLTVDGDEIDPTKCSERGCPFDPGEHSIDATGRVFSLNGEDHRKVTLRNGETATVALTLVPVYKGPTRDDEGLRRCIAEAETLEAIKACIEPPSTLVVKAGTAFSAYTDTNRVQVVTPEASASLSSPTAGWNVGGTFLVDVVSAASPDIVSEASPPFHETRAAGTLSGGYKPALYGAQVNAHYSREPDYVSLGAGIDLTADLKNKQLTPRLGYGYTHDRIGRTDTVDTYSVPFDTHDIDAGVTMVLSTTTVLVTGLSLVLERGDQSKPYRYIPMFQQSQVGAVGAGQSTDSVNQGRLSFRPLEQLPTARDRYAASGRIMHRFATTTLRVEERLYYDTWHQLGTTTDARYIFDFGERLRAWPHLRLNAQTGANFYQLAYAAAVNADGSVTLPVYRSSDRELSPLLTVTAGGGAHYDLARAKAKTQYGLTLQGDVMYTYFFNALYITRRTAVYGSLNFDIEFQ